MKNTFRGGVHPEGHKELSRESRLRLFDPKGEMVFPLSQHIGKPAKPVVKKNDEVKTGNCLQKPTALFPRRFTPAVPER